MGVRREQSGFGSGVGGFDMRTTSGSRLRLVSAPSAHCFQNVRQALRSDISISHNSGYISTDAALQMSSGRSGAGKSVSRWGL